MKKKEFWRAYRASQDKVVMSEEFKQAVYEATESDAQEVGANNARAANATHTALTPQTKEVSSSRKFGRKNLLPRFAIPVAACLAFALALVGVFSFMDKGAPSAPVVTNFTVQAYALDTNKAIEQSSDDLIVFSRTSSLNGMPSKQDYLGSTGGYYTGSLFGVQGDNITRLQASVSTGVIYRCEIEDMKRDDDVERWRELVSWKDSTRGLGSYFKNYDDVQAVGYAKYAPDGSALNDPKTSATVIMSKKLGSTIDIPINEETANYRFGFWTNEDYGNAGPVASTNAVMDLFDGAELTVTATFADGTASTQIIELKTGDVRASATQMQDEAWVVDIIPEIIDAESVKDGSDEQYEHVIYGKVVESNDGAFPGSLDNANELANKVDEGYVFERRDWIVPYEATDGERMQVVDFAPKAAGESFATSITGYFNVNSADYDERSVPMTLSNLTATKSKTLPADISLDDLETGLGSWEYFNKVTGEMDGFTIDDKGTTSEGFSWLLMEATLTDNSDQQFEAFSGDLGRVFFADADGQVFGVNAREVHFKDIGLSSSSAPTYANLAFAAHESQTVRWLIVVPDEVVGAPTVLYVGNSYAPYSLSAASAEDYSGANTSMPNPEACIVEVK